MTASEYLAAMSRIEALVRKDPDPGTPEGRELMALADTIIEFELATFGNLQGQHHDTPATRELLEELHRLRGRDDPLRGMR